MLLQFHNNLQKLPCCPTKVVFAITIQEIRPLNDYKYLLEYYDKYDITRIRVSLDVNKLWQNLGNRDKGKYLYSVVRYLSEHGFAVNTELCAMSHCMFTEYEDSYLRSHYAGYHELITCEPNLDIFPDLSILYCASRPRSSVFSRQLQDFCHYDHARDYFRALRDSLSNNNPSDMCGTCSHYKNECKLNCLSRFDNSILSNSVESNMSECPSNIYVLPLLNNWHVYEERNGNSNSFVLDEISMEIVKQAWHGYSLETIATNIANDYNENVNNVLDDTKEVLDKIGWIGIP